jgi:hypothetical protein
MIALEQDKVGIMKVQRPRQWTNSAYDTHVFEPTLEVDHDTLTASLASSMVFFFTSKSWRQGING